MTTLEKAEKLIKHKKIAVIGSCDENVPYVKAVLVEKKDGIKTFWFGSNTPSLRAQQYMKNPNASIYFFNRVLYKGVMLSGKMEVLTDAESKKALWKPSFKHIYAGVDDPEYCVLKFTAESGKYYFNLHKEDFAL